MNTDGNIEQQRQKRPPLAKIISRRATDLLGIAIVTVGVLSVSGRLTEWWNTDSGALSGPEVSAGRIAGSALRWGTGESPVSLLAGDAPVRIERRSMHGDQDRIDRVLRDRLIELARSTSSGGGTAHSLETSNEEERSDPHRERISRLLSLLEDTDPVESEPGQWHLYRLDHEDSFVVGSFLIATRPLANESDKPQLVGWAMAIPGGTHAWTSFVMIPANTDSRTTGSKIIIPRNADVVFSLSNPAGDELTVFQQTSSAVDQLASWIREIDNLAGKAGWQPVRGWQQSTNSASARFEWPADDATSNALAVEYSVSVDDSGRLNGLANVIAVQQTQIQQQ